MNWKIFLKDFYKSTLLPLVGYFVIFLPVSWAARSLPLPRFASLRSEEVNLRVGPGSEYPIEWVFRYEKMPIEIVQEFGPWRKIRDFERAEGWVHQSMLSGKRTALITGCDVILRKNPDKDSKGMAHLKPHTSGKLLECHGQWCRLQIEKHKGWLQRTQIWGVYPTETKF